MSILNLASDGLFTVLIVLVRSLVAFGPKSREDLFEHCGAGLDIVDAKQLGPSLMRWTELGLFVVEEGIVNIRHPYQALLGKKPDDAEAALPRILRTIALAPENTERFWESEQNRSADFVRGLSWALAQDVYELDTSSSNKVAALERQQIIDPDRHIFQNDTRWNGGRTWMQYLGFARGGTQLSIDPTEALRDSLGKIFGDEHALAASDFLARTARTLPVLDGGEYRLKVEEVLNEAAWKRPPDRHISSSLSRAIQRLDREGLLALEQKSDSVDGMSLTGTNQRTWFDVTHIRRIEIKKGK